MIKKIFNHLPSPDGVAKKTLCGIDATSQYGPRNAHIISLEEWSKNVDSQCLKCRKKKLLLEKE